MTNATTTRQTILTVFLVWSLTALTPIGADWLTSIGVGEWTAVWVAALAPPAVAPVGIVHWRRTGKRPSSWWLVLAWMSAPAIVLALPGLVTGAASRGHVFVLVFAAIPAVLVAVIFALLRPRG